jgi:hypothetical protein
MSVNGRRVTPRCARRRSSRVGPVVCKKTENGSSPVVLRKNRPIDSAPAGRSRANDAEAQANASVMSPQTDARNG